MDSSSNNGHSALNNHEQAVQPQPQQNAQNGEPMPRAVNNNQTKRSSSSNPFQAFTSLGMQFLDEGSEEHLQVERHFVAPMGRQGMENINISAIHKFSSNCPFGKERQELFASLVTAAFHLSVGHRANVKYGWLGLAKEELCRIVSLGFRAPSAPQFGELLAVGIHLSPIHLSLDSLDETVEDIHGLCHVMLCRAILGNQEVIPPRRHQLGPSSPVYDSGVDRLENPTKYVVWGSSMNTRILPCYIVSFQMTPLLKRIVWTRCTRRVCKAELIQNRSHFIDELCRFISLDQVSLLQEAKAAFNDGRVDRSELEMVVAQFGDRQAAQDILQKHNLAMLALEILGEEEIENEGDGGERGIGGIGNGTTGEHGDVGPRSM